MSNNTIPLIQSSDLFSTWTSSYNQAVWELNNDVLRTEKTINGNLTSNAALSVFGLVLNSTPNISIDFTNTLESRNGELFYNGKHVALVTAIYGYGLGGSTGTAVTTADRVTFSTSSTAAYTPANLSQARSSLAGVSDGAIYGYTLGGTTGAQVATADRTTFYTGITAAHTPADLSTIRQNGRGISDGAVYGYVMGGNSGTFVATSDRITFSTSTTAAHTPADLSTIRSSGAGLSDESTYGYMLGGITAVGALVATADRVTFSTSTTAAYTPANLSGARYFMAGVSYPAYYGYILGGQDANGSVATSDRLTFSTGITVAYTPANLSQARRDHVGTSDGDVYGYGLGGDIGSFVVTADRVTFSTSITAAHTPANLSQARASLAGLSDGMV